MTVPDYFAAYPDPPISVTVGGAVARQIDGLGFRLHAALNGLREADCSFRICDDGMSIGELVSHIFQLVNWVHGSVAGEKLERPDTVQEQGALALKMLEELRQTFVTMSDVALAELTLGERPFWSIMNMPLSDATHHAGQICAMRRGAGNPITWPRS